MASSSTSTTTSPYVNDGLPKKRSIPPLKLFDPPKLPAGPNILQGQPFQLEKESTEKRLLVLLPSNNKEKYNLVDAYFKEHLPPNSTCITMQLFNSSSGVGEQPYNEAGVEGAYYRVDHAMLTMVVQPGVQAVVQHDGITSIIWVSIESFIARPGWPPAPEEQEPTTVPVDYGFILMYNPVTRVAKTGVSWGVSVPMAYYNEAQKYGFRDPKGQALIRKFGKGKTLSEETQRNHGKVTVGEIMAANMEGVDKANWHKSLTKGRVCRYKLIADAMEKMEIPW